MNYSIDTRTLKKGDVFIPVSGHRFDGHQFIQTALRKGASKVFDIDIGKVASDHRQQFNIPIIAVTGSSGKTTVKELLSRILGTRYHVLKSRDNQNNEIGVPLTLLQLASHHTMAVVEFGMRQMGEIAYLASVARPTHVIITNVGPAHIGRLGGLSDVAHAKAEIFHPFAASQNKVAYLNSHDHFFSLLHRRAVQNGFTVRTFEASEPWKQNDALVSRVAADFGIRRSVIHRHLSSRENIPGRLSTHHIPGGPMIIDDTYNANPDSMRTALHTLAQCKERRQIAVLGDMLELGSYCRYYHTQIRDYLESLGIPLVLTYGRWAKLYQPRRRSSAHFTNVNELNRRLKILIQPMDAILVKGSRDMKMERIVRSLIQHASPC